MLDNIHLAQKKALKNEQRNQKDTKHTENKK